MVKINWIVAVFLLGLTGLFAIGCQTAGRLETGSRSGLDVASKEWDRLFNGGDAEGLAALYDEDAVSMPPNLPTLKGRKALEEDFRKFFAENTARHETFVDEIVVDGSMAIERGRYRMTFKPKAGGAETVEEGRHVEIRKRVGREWKIVMEIWNVEGK
jgi:ketosteroid isomerase-like protein